MFTITKEHVLAGRCTFTVEVPAGPPADKTHYTYRVTYRPAEGQWPEAYFAALMTGSDNEASFRYLGKVLPLTGEVRMSAKSCVSEGAYPAQLLRRVLALTWAGTPAAYLDKGFRTGHAGKCCKCGRTLTTPESLDRGYGPECAKSFAAVAGRAVA